MPKPTQQKTKAQHSPFVDYEYKILQLWAKEKTFQQVQKQHINDPPYGYYDGPPFATGKPHHGHLLASTIKDVVPRYFEMCGHHVPRQFGWDCHGLPIEHEIDKSLGLSTQEAVTELGLAGYNTACRQIVQRYTKEWEKTIERLGRWVDFDDHYKTMDLNFMESLWWAFGQLWEKDLIYQGVKVVPFSTALQTGLSNFESSLNYQSVQSPAITVLLDVPEEDFYLAIWTTTPWTLPTNLAVGFGPHEYIKAKHPSFDKAIVMAKAALLRRKDADQFTDTQPISLEKLSQITYTPPFQYLNASDLNTQCFTLLQDDFVTIDDGTGLVHLAPSHGEDDHRVCTAHDIPSLILLDHAGKFIEQAGDLAGLYFKDANKPLINKLKNSNMLLDNQVIEHNYPFCYRSDTPLIYRTIPSWYVAVTKIKEKLLDANESINWVPSHIKHGRFGKWLANAKDWAISRNRYWGTPIPVWVNDQTGKKLCIDSLAKLKQFTGKSLTDIHSEFVDPLTFTIAGEPGTYRRVSEVLDCWFESGSVPFAQWHYPFENKQKFEDVFPAQFIAEGIDQTRGWFYTLTVISAALFDGPAFKNVIVSGIVMAEDGKKMSKRLKNYTAPDALMDTYGADALRLYLIQSNLVRGEEMSFNDLGVKEMTRKVQLPWFNAYQFFSSYAKIDQWLFDGHLPIFTNPIDRWILSKLQTLIINVNAQMQAYHLHNIVIEAQDFLEDLTNTYIRLNRQRFWQSGMNDDKNQAYICLFHILESFSKLMAPFAPFLSDHVYRQLVHFSSLEHYSSVHMEKYPQGDQKQIDPHLMDAFKRIQNILVMGRATRNDARIKIKTPLKQIKIIHAQDQVLQAIKPLEHFIKDELNVKNVLYDDQEDRYIDLTIKLNLVKLGRKLGPSIASIQEDLAKLDDVSKRMIERGDPVTIAGHRLAGDDFLVIRKAIAGSGAVSEGSISIALDLNLTEDLIAEGQARELTGLIQKQRKEEGFEISDRIALTLYANPSLLKVFTDFKSSICHETLIVSHALEPLEDRSELNIDFSGLKGLMLLKPEQ